MVRKRKAQCTKTTEERKFLKESDKKETCSRGVRCTSGKEWSSARIESVVFRVKIVWCFIFFFFDLSLPPQRVCVLSVRGGFCH